MKVTSCLHSASNINFIRAMLLCCNESLLNNSGLRVEGLDRRRH